MRDLKARLKLFEARGNWFRKRRFMVNWHSYALQGSDPAEMQATQALLEVLLQPASTIVK
eukprot:9477391-Pyramimonas_sp.AAC.1